MAVKLDGKFPAKRPKVTEYRQSAEIVAEDAVTSVEFIRLLTRAKLDIFLMDKELRSRFSSEEMEMAGQAYKALYRTLANLIIGTLDVVPVTGDVPSWVVDGLKVTRSIIRWMKIKVKMMPKPIQDTLDLTPDVSLAKAVGTEALELVTFGFIPSHLMFEFREQYRHDLPKMVTFLQKVVKEKDRLEAERQ